jgi:hypothetical protein
MLFILIAAGWLVVVAIVLAACRVAAAGDEAMTARSRGEIPMAKRMLAGEPNAAASPSRSARDGGRRRAPAPAIERARVPGAR